MRVNLNQIGREKEEHADFHIHEMDESVKRLSDYVEQELFRCVSLLCTRGEEFCRVSSQEILFIETVKEKQHIHTESSLYEIKKRLYELERILPSNFIRISKSVILNVNKVQTYTPMFNGLMQVSMINSEKTYISRKYLKEVKDRILEVKNYE